jgi:hypothetical protein
MFIRFVQALVAVFLLALSVPCGAGGEATGNLLVNGDAESHRCTSDWTAQSPVPGWRVVRGATSVLCYDAFAFSGVTPNLPPDLRAGRALFAAPGIDSAMEQSVDVSLAASAIDQDAVTYQLSGWLGGWSGRVQSALVTAVFLNDRGEATGVPAILADSDPADAARAGLVARQIQGQLPAGTRTIEVTVDFPSGMVSFQNAFADNLALTLGGVTASLSSAPLQSPSAGAIPRLDHVYIVMMENTNYADVVHGDAPSSSIDGHMPFLASLAQSGVILSNMWATYHPSDQNYVAMVAGDTYRFGPVYYPDFDLFPTHLGDLLDARAKPWRGYVQHMNTPCNLVADTNGGWFSPDDEPFANFEDIISHPARCTATLRDLNDFEAAVRGGGALPDFAWLAADGWWDGEGAWMESFDVGFSQARQDEFLRSSFASLVQSAQWRDSRSLLIVTWDEANGWGWPDDHVPTIIVGSPGLLREGQVIDTRYDGYGVLRTVELALGVEGLGRFDEYARPLADIFASSGDSSQLIPPAEVTLRPSQAAATRGSLRATFGQSSVPTAVTQGEALRLFTAPGLSGTAAVAPLGRAPAQGGGWVIDPSGAVTVSTAELVPGTYGAWLELAGAPPAHAPLPFTVLPRSAITPADPGVEIVGAATHGASGRPTAVREGANVTVRYCRPHDGAPSAVWVGVFAAGTPNDQRTRANANLIGNWLKTPGNSPSDPCGEASAFTSELTPSTSYEIWLMKDQANGSSISVGAHAQFEFLPTLP